LGGGTLAAEAFEFVEGLVEGAFQAGLVTGQVVHGAAAAEPVLEGVGEIGGLLKVVVLGLEVFIAVSHFEIPEGGFGVANAADAPGGGDHLLDEKGLGCSGRGVLGEEVVAEGFEFRFILVVDEEALCGESMKL
jgi:hypothetical protein